MISVIDTIKAIKYSDQLVRHLCQSKLSYNHLETVVHSHRVFIGVHYPSEVFQYWYTDLVNCCIDYPHMIEYWRERKRRKQERVTLSRKETALAATRTSEKSVTCAACGQAFSPKRKHARTCSPRCRKALSRSGQERP